MGKQKKVLEVTELRAVQTTSYERELWSAILTFVLMIGCLWSLNQTWMSFSPSILLQSGAGTAALLCCIVSHCLKKKYPAAILAAFLPFPVLLFFSRPSQWFLGGKAWADIIEAQWEIFYDGGTQLTSITASNADVFAFTLLTAVLLTELLWLFVSRRRIPEICILSFLILLLQLLTGSVSMLGSGLIIFSAAGLILSEKDLFISRKCIAWTLLIGVALCCSLGMLPNDIFIGGVSELRQNAEIAIHEFRYGEDVLPEGNLRLADSLHEETTEQLEITSEQKKNLYLRGFIGGVYENGQWKAIARSAYKGKYKGMLSWLEKRGFHPLTQISDYYSLNPEGSRPNANKIAVKVTGASSYYIYTPSSLEKMDNLRCRNLQDNRLTHPGFFGAGDYAMTEFSGQKPSELVVAEEWVRNPQTEEQKQYCESEAVYRDFVYSTYVSVNNDLYRPMQELFWDDYDADSDGIFSAVEHIRKKLRGYLSYTDSPQAAPEDEDPILWSLKNSHEANAVIYASAATEALRAHGIPARYVEGYYVPGEKTEENSGNYVLTGEDAHAWTEVYYDGIGWLPLDVTPGYYYDTVKLQGMISASDKAEKNAVLNDNLFEGKELSDKDSKKGTSHLAGLLKEHPAAGILAGILLLLLIAASVVIVILEVLRMICILTGRKIYLQASSQQKTELNMRRIYFMLAFWHIDAGLGWKTKETDERIAEQFPEIQRGEYIRICEILEKAFFGEMEIESYEDRTVRSFLGKLYRIEESYSLAQKLRLRYVTVSFARKQRMH